MEKCGSLEYANAAKPFIVGLSGYAQTGKDTVAQILVQKYGYTRVSFADALRTGLYKLNPIVDIDATIRDGYLVDVVPYRLATIVDSIGWERAKTEYSEVRELLQRYGTEAGREIHGASCWIDIVKQQMASNPSARYVISDIRFPNEYELLSQNQGISVRVVRDGVTAVNSHVSDSYVPEVNYTINNNGTKLDLEEEIEKVLGHIL